MYEVLYNPRIQAVRKENQVRIKGREVGMNGREGKERSPREEARGRENEMFRGGKGKLLEKFG